MYIHAYTYRQTPTGWINNQEFKDAIFQKLIPHINVTREKLQGRRALLLLDGHSTRLQREIWVELNKKNIDVLCIPAHTSNFTQSLDLCVNGQFKRLLGNVRGFPKKNEMEKKLKIFVGQVCDSIYDALKPKIVRKGFIFFLIY